MADSSKSTKSTSKKEQHYPIRETRTDWHDLFLEALRKRPNISKAVLTAGVDRSTAYNHRHDIPDFALQWDDALKVGMDALIDEGVERAFNGSDTLLIFLAKAHDPKYRDRHEITIRREELEKMSDDELASLAEGKQP